VPDDRLAELTRRARDDLVRIAHPDMPWLQPRIGPDGRPALNVLIVGTGQSGIAIASASCCERVLRTTNVPLSVTMLYVRT
jgi:FAD-dependent urate hydroxylase